MVFKHKVIIIGNTLLLVFLIVTSQIIVPVFAQENIANELSKENEQYVVDNIIVRGERYSVVTYDNGEVLLLDDVSILITSTSTLNDVFGVKSFRELFNQNNLTSNNIATIYNSIDIIHTNAKFINEIMAWLTLVAGMLGIISIVVGGIAIPLTLMIGAVKIATNYIGNNIKIPRATISDLLSTIEKTEGIEAEPLLFEQTLNKVDETKTQLTELNNELILDITGIENLAYYNAIYLIGDAIELVAEDQALDLFEYGYHIETSQKHLENTLVWLNTLNTENIKQLATTKTNDYTQMHNQRIETRTTEYRSFLTTTQSLLTEKRNNLNTASQQGYQTTEAYRVLSATETKIDNAKEFATEYRFRTAMDMLEESTVSLQQIDSLIVRPEITTTTSTTTSTTTAITTPTVSNDNLYITIVAFLVLIIGYMIYRNRKTSAKQ